MAKITPFDYHGSESKHGSYQYVSLKKVVDFFYGETFDDDSILKNTARYKILAHTKDAISEINKTLFTDARMMEMTVSEKLYFILPHDYVNYLRVSISVYDEDTQGYRLYPLNLNPNMNIADGYLQDHNYDIIFDDDGYILKADATNVYQKAYKRYQFSSSCNGGYGLRDTSKLSKYGEFTIDKRQGRIAFSSDVMDKDVVMEYISDGLSFDTYGEGSIKVHKDIIQTLKDRIYFTLIQYKGKVSNTEKNRALLRYKTTLHESKVKTAGFDIVQINRVMGSSSKNI